MAIENAKALIQKLQSDKSFAQDFALAKSAQDFLDLAAKQGYDVTLEEFTDALDQLKDAIEDLKDALEDSYDDDDNDDDDSESDGDNDGDDGGDEEEQIDQAVGLSIVGVDYTFTAVQTAST